MPKSKKRPQPPEEDDEMSSAQQPQKRRRAAPSASPGPSSHAESARPTPAPESRKLRPTLYDAVAGRLAIKGFRDSFQNRRASYWVDTPLLGDTPLAPRDALFKQSSAPDLYEEEALYEAHRRLKEPDEVEEAELQNGKGGVGRLPESDLLKALHSYVSDYYAATTPDGGRCDWRSLDESALLALGMMMEEEIGRAMGKNGWTVFLDPEHGPKENVHETVIKHVQEQRGGQAE